MLLEASNIWGNKEVLVVFGSRPGIGNIRHRESFPAENSFSGHSDPLLMFAGSYMHFLKTLVSICLSLLIMALKKQVQLYSFFIIQSFKVYYKQS